MPLPDIHEDRSLYVLEGAITVADDLFDAGRMVVFRPGDAVSITTGSQGARVMVLGHHPRGAMLHLVELRGVFARTYSRGERGMVIRGLARWPVSIAARR